MSIVLARIDDRLIHGQVMTSWLNYTGANKIVVIDDTTANDSFMTMIITSLVPANIKTEVTTEDNAMEVLQSLTDNDKVIVLAKTPSPYYKLIQNGYKFEKINIGGIGIKPGRSKLYRNIAVSDEERKQLKAIIDAGIDVEIQMVAEDNPIDVSKHI